MTGARKVLVHVGAPKTGTSFVQDLLFQNRERLAGQGVLYPAERFDAHFLAALDLMELPWGGLERQAVGAWDRLAERVRCWEGTVVVSHEILATASPEQVRRALDSFGADSEVHIVVSVRDLVRQVPAEWQENVKHRRTVGYRAFLDAIMDPVGTGPVATWFWGVQDVPAILGRWAATVPASRVHVVTVPRAGAPRELLWHRFASVFGLDPDAFDITRVERANPSLGVAESALVRTLNQRVNGVLANEHYREFVRELLAHRTLSRRQGKVPLRLPEDARAWAEGISEHWIEELDERGYEVVGSLDELRPDAPWDESAYLDPDADHPALVREVAVDSLVTVLLRAGELRREVEELRGQLEGAFAERDQARREVGFLLRAKRRLVAHADSSRAAGMALRVYRRARGR